MILFMVIFLTTILGGGGYTLIYILRKLREKRKSDGVDGDDQFINGIEKDDYDTNGNVNKSGDQIDEKFNVNNDGGGFNELRNENNDKNENKLDEEMVAIRVNIFINYLDFTYWKKRLTTGFYDNRYENYTQDNRLVSDYYDNRANTRQDNRLKPVLRISKSRRKIHIVYSKNALWNLAFSENLQSGRNEKFALIFKGLKSWSVDETRGRFSDVMQDLFVFRQEIQQELIKRLSTLLNKSNKMTTMKSRPTKIKEPESIVPMCDDPLGCNIVCEREELNFVNNNKPGEWKMYPPQGLERAIPSVCFVIPFRDTEVPGLICGIEIQYKHLLTTWSNQKWDVKQSVTSSEVRSLLKILKPISNENEEASKFMIDVEEDGGQVMDDDVREEYKKFHSISEPADLISTHSEKRDEEKNEVIEEPCVESEDMLLYKEPDTLFDDDDDEFKNYDIDDDNKDIVSHDFISEEINCLNSIDDLFYRLENILEVLKSNSKNLIDEHSISQELQGVKDVHENVYKQLYPEYRNLTIEASQTKSDEIKKKITLLIDQWNLMVYNLNTCNDRLNNADVVITTANKLDLFLCNAEEVLIAQHGITANTDDIQKQYIQVVDLENKFTSFKNNLEKLKKVSENICDIELSEINRVIKRWDDSFIQLQGRKEKLKKLQNEILDFRHVLTTQMQWLESVYKMFKSDDVTALLLTENIALKSDEGCTLKSEEIISDNERIEKLFKEYIDISRNLTLHRKPIQEAFYKAEEFILTSKSYENDLKEFSFYVNGYEDESCRYYIVDQAREWVAYNTLKLSQLYELVLNELPQRINILLSSINFYTENIKPDVINNQTDSFIYDGDNSISYGDNISYWEFEVEKLSIWIEEKEIELSKEMPSYSSIEDLNSYIVKLQDILKRVDREENWVNTTLNSIHNALQGHPTFTRCVRENMRLKVISLEIRWSKLQWDIEGCSARLIPLYKILHSYEKVLKPFTEWLEKTEYQARIYDVHSSSFDMNTEPFDPNTSDLENFQNLFSKHEKFLSDVIHHETDLQKVYHHGKMLLSSAKGLQTYLTDFPDSLSTGVSGTSQIWDLERNLYEVKQRYKTLVCTLSFNGTLIYEFVQKHQDYFEKIEVYISWLAETERQVTKLQIGEQLTPKEVFMKMEIAKHIHRDIERHYNDLVLIQIASDTLSTLHKSSNECRMRDADRIYSLKISTDMLTGMWDYTTDSIMKRYENLCTNVMNLTSRIQSLYVNNKDINIIVDEMSEWVHATKQLLNKMDNNFDTNRLMFQIREMKMISSEFTLRQHSVESMLKDLTQENTSKIQDQQSKEHLINLRTLFVELRLCIVDRNELCTSACKEHVNGFNEWLVCTLDHLKSDNVLSIDITLLQKNIMKIIEDLKRHEGGFQVINQCGYELISIHTNEQSIAVLSHALDSLNKNWKAISIELMNQRRQCNEVLVYTQIYEETFQPLFRWLEKMEECIKNFSPVSLHSQVLADQLIEQKVLLNDAYSHNGTVEIHTDMVELSLYDLYSQYTTEVSYDPTTIELQVNSIRDRFEHVLSVLEHRSVYLKTTHTRLEEYNKTYDELTEWFQRATYEQIKSNPIGEDLDDVIKQCCEYQNYERDLDRVSLQVQWMLKLGTELIEGKTEIDGAPVIKSLNEKIKLRWEVIRKTTTRYHHAIKCSLERSFIEKHNNMVLLLTKICEEALDISTAHEETITVKKDIRDLSHDVTLYGPALNTLYEAADILIKCSQVDQAYVMKMVNELDESCRKLDNILKNCKYFHEEISLKNLKGIRIGKEISSGEINHLSKQTQEDTDMSVQGRIPHRMPMVQDRLSPCPSYIDMSEVQQGRIPHMMPTVQDRLSPCPSDELFRVGRNVDSGCCKVPSPGHYTSYKSTVERHTRVFRSHICNKLHRISVLNDYMLDPCSNFDDVDGNTNLYKDGTTDDVYTIPDSITEKIVTTDDGCNIRKITSTSVRRTERKIVRRKYIDEDGNQCTEEFEIPEGEGVNIQDEEEYLDNGAVIIKTPEENQATTEEEFVRDIDGNITKWIIKKRTYRTKRTRVIRRIIGNDIDVAPLSYITVIKDKQSVHREPITPCNITLSTVKEEQPSENLYESNTLSDTHRNQVNSITKQHMWEPGKRFKVVVSSDQSGDDCDNEVSTIMRIYPRLVHKLFVSNVIPSTDEKETHGDIRTVAKQPFTYNNDGDLIINGAEIDHELNGTNSPYSSLEAISGNGYYQDINLRCIKTSENENEHICPEHMQHLTHVDEHDSILDVDGTHLDEDTTNHNNAPHSNSQMMSGNGYYQGVNLRCIKTSENESEHICPEHILNEEQQPDETSKFNEDINDHIPTTTHHVTTSKRKGFKMCIYMSDKSGELYEDNARANIRARGSRKLIVRNIMKSPRNEKMTFDHNENVTSSDTKQHNTTHNNNMKTTSIVSHTNTNGSHITTSVSQNTYTLSQTLSQIETSISRNIHSKSQTDMSTSQSTPVVSQAKTIVSISVDDDGNHTSITKQHTMGRIKRVKKIIFTPKRSDRTRDAKWNTTIAMASKNVHKLVVNRSIRSTMADKTQTNMPSTSHDETDVNLDEKLKTTEENDTCSRNQVPSSNTKEPKLSKGGGFHGVKFRQSFSHANKTNTTVTKTESIRNKNKTIVHITVRNGENDKKTEVK